MYLSKLPNVLSKFQKDRTVTQFLLSPILIHKRQKDKNIVSCSVTQSVILHITFFRFTSTDPLEYMMLLYSKDSTLSMCHFSLASLHSVYSNVSSNGLPERMHTHIGCICSTFLHCVFSNVSSNGLPQKMQSHTGYVCLAFVHCAFSYVSSTCLPENM